MYREGISGMNLLGHESESGYDEGFSGGFDRTSLSELRARMKEKQKQDAKHFRMAVAAMLTGIGVLGLVTWILIG